MNKWFVSIILCFFLSFYVVAQPEVRVGVLKYGTVNWEIDVIKHHQLDKKYQFELKVTSLASKNASFITAETIQVGGGQALGI